MCFPFTFAHNVAFCKQLHNGFLESPKLEEPIQVHRKTSRSGLTPPGSLSKPVQGPPRAADANLTPSDTPATRCNFLTRQPDRQPPEHCCPHFPTPPPPAKTPPHPRKRAPRTPKSVLSTNDYPGRADLGEAKGEGCRAPTTAQERTPRDPETLVPPICPRQKAFRRPRSVGTGSHVDP